MPWAGNVTSRTDAAVGISRPDLAREPTPVQAAALADTLEEVFRDVEPLERRMVELRLQGSGLDEIAADVRRSERTVSPGSGVGERAAAQLYPEIAGL